MELAVPAHLVRRSSHRIHRERTGSEQTDSNDGEKYGAKARRLSVLELGSDAAREHEEQHPEDDEINYLNPPARTERQFTDIHSECLIAGAKPALEREHRHEKCRANHACPRPKLPPVHSCFVFYLGKMEVPSLQAIYVFCPTAALDVQLATRDKKY